jgi:hypothetical protein
VALAIDDLVTPPSFFDLVYRLVADFEGHQEAAASGRYFLMPQGWLSSFSEMYAAVSGLAVEDIAVTDRGTAIKLSDGAVLRFAGDRVEVGQGPWPPPEPAVAAVCWKNLEFEPCSLKFVKSIAVGKKISSAGDFGSYLEFGLDQRLNLGLHRDGLHVFSTENPVDDHRL